MYKVKQPTGEGVGPLEATAMDCEPVALFPKASTEIEPNQTDPNLLRLFDGKYTSIENALTWGLPRFNWFYLEFDFGETVFIDSLQIMLNNFDSRYRSNTFILYASHDGITYGQVGKPIVNDLPFVGERVLMFDGVGASSRYFRLAIKGEKFATIAEIEFMGCGGIN
ncbi:MAG TPA: discoidin domain-containing protein [Flavobacteriales bacterium]|nr:discoidin domain-containing protein [Flavobacteriales bacterium]